MEHVSVFQDCTKLEGEGNYLDWAFEVQTLLMGYGLWKHVEVQAAPLPPEPSSALTYTDKDRETLVYIRLCCSPSQYPYSHG